jgi:hypothetical protein
VAQPAFTSVGNFFVQDRSGNYYPATFLADANGNPIVDTAFANVSKIYPASRLMLYADDQGITPYLNPNNYLVVPSADFMNNLVARGQMSEHILIDYET